VRPLGRARGNAESRVDTEPYSAHHDWNKSGSGEKWRGSEEEEEESRKRDEMSLTPTTKVVSASSTRVKPVGCPSDEGVYTKYYRVLHFLKFISLLLYYLLQLKSPSWLYQNSSHTYKLVWQFFRCYICAFLSPFVLFVFPGETGSSFLLILIHFPEKFKFIHIHKKTRQFRMSLASVCIWLRQGGKWRRIGRFLTVKKKRARFNSVRSECH
jgi:hypothetical protein